MERPLLNGIQASIKRRDYRFSAHAVARITERDITVEEVEAALLGDSAQVIEDYPEDPRGASCLLCGMTKERRPLHVQCTYPPYVVIITAYEPKPDEWIDWRIRKGG